MPWKPGTRLRSAADTTEVIVIRGPSEEVDLRCGGHPVVAAGTNGGAGQLSLDRELAGGTQLGKRYISESVGLEVLCTKAGAGSLSIGNEVLSVKGAKPLPASD